MLILVGIVSPNFESCIGDNGTTRNITIQRYILDEKISFAAKLVGATIKTNFEVDYIKFDEENKRWIVGNTEYNGKKKKEKENNFNYL